MTKRTQNRSIRAARIAKQNGSGLQKNITKTAHQRQKSWRLLDWANIFQVLLSSALNSGWIAGKAFLPFHVIPTSSAGIFNRMQNRGFDRLVTQKRVLFFTQLRKKICQKSSRVSFRNSGVNLWSVMTLGMVKDAGTLLYGSGFWI